MRGGPLRKKPERLAFRKGQLGGLRTRLPNTRTMTNGADRRQQQDKYLSRCYKWDKELVADKSRYQARPGYTWRARREPTEDSAHLQRATWAIDIAREGGMDKGQRVGRRSVFQRFEY